MEIINGDILNSNEEYIAHQTNCISVNSMGLAKSISNNFKHGDFYKLRKENNHKSKPGTINILGNGNEERFIICMNAQYKPGAYSSNSEFDSYENRKQWFKECLLEMEKLNAKSIAFPYNIGCGLARGKWNDYLNMIECFAKRNENIKIVIYKL